MEARRLITNLVDISVLDSLAGFMARPPRGVLQFICLEFLFGFVSFVGQLPRWESDIIFHISRIRAYWSLEGHQVVLVLKL